MELSASSTALLQEIPIPAFAVRSGIVFDANAAARQQGVENGSAIENLLGFWGMLLFDPFEWESKFSFEISICKSGYWR